MAILARKSRRALCAAVVSAEDYCIQSARTVEQLNGSSAANAGKPTWELESQVSPRWLLLSKGVALVG